MEIIRKLAVKLTREEYILLRDAANLIKNIVAEINTDDFGEDYDFIEASHIIYAFLDDKDVYVEFEKQNEMERDE